jgi:hypothetical protein
LLPSFSWWHTGEKATKWEGPMQHNSVTLLAALAVSVVGVSLGAGTAHADVVRPGLTCDRNWQITTCNNTTNTDYTVIATRECSGGTYTTTVPQTQYGPNGTSTTTYTFEIHSVDPSVEQDNIFVPANNTGTIMSGCPVGSDTKRVSYSVGPPPPPAR